MNFTVLKQDKSRTGPSPLGSVKRSQAKWRLHSGRHANRQREISRGIWKGCFRSFEHWFDHTGWNKNKQRNGREVVWDGDGANILIKLLSALQITPSVLLLKRAVFLVCYFNHNDRTFISESTIIKFNIEDFWDMRSLLMRSLINQSFYVYYNLITNNILYNALNVNVYHSDSIVWKHEIKKTCWPRCVKR